MGKTEKGAIWVLKEKTSPYEFYQYFYNQKDEDVEHFFKVLTALPLDEIKTWLAGDIREAKHKMAYEITKFIHSEEDAQDAQKTAFELFQKQNNGENAPTFEIDKNLAQNGINVLELFVMSNLCGSKGEARRLAEQNGLSVDNEKVVDINKIYSADQLSGGLLLKKGKKFFVKIVVKD